jgi:hypothetical protein
MSVMRTFQVVREPAAFNTRFRKLAVKIIRIFKPFFKLKNYSIVIVIDGNKR